MTQALLNSTLQQARAQEHEGLARNRRYAAQIRSAGIAKDRGQFAKLHELLLSETPSPGEKDLRGFEWRYSRRCARGFMLPGHPSHVTMLAYSQNGDKLASGHTDGMIQLFDRRTGNLVAQLPGHNVPVRKLDFLKNDTQLVSTGFRRTVEQDYRAEFIQWTLGSKPTVSRRRDYPHLHHGNYPFRLARIAGILFIIDRGNSLHRVLKLDLEKGTETELLRRNCVNAFAVSPNADRFALVCPRQTSTSASNRLELLDSEAKEQIAAAEFSDGVHIPTFAPDGRTLAIGSGSGPDTHRIEIREVPSLRLKTQIRLASVADAITFDWQGNRLAVGAAGNRFHFFEVASGRCLGSYTDAVGSRGFFPERRGDRGRHRNRRRSLDRHELL